MSFAMEDIMNRLLALLLAAMTMVGASYAQATAAVDPNGWVKEVAIANKLLAAGYVDAAQKDFEGIIQRYPATSAGVDKSWLGLSKIHMARYEYDQAKVSLEEILKRNSDAESVAGAKTTYRQLKQEADGQAQQAQQALQFVQMQYDQTSWLNPFAKLFTYLDLKKARTAADTALAAANGYDPHYFIDDVAASAIRTDYSISGTEFKPGGLDAPATGAAASTIAATGATAGVSVHTPAPGASATASTTAASSTLAGTGMLPGTGTLAGTTSAGLLTMPAAGASPTPVGPAAGVVATLGNAALVSPAPLPSPLPSAAASLVAAPSPAPVASSAPVTSVVSASPKPAASPAASSTAVPVAAAEPDLMTLQRAYQESYRQLQEAISMGNQSRIVTLNAGYQKSLDAYRAAAAAGRR